MPSRSPLPTPRPSTSEDRLGAYSAAAASALLALSPAAEAQIVYTDVVPNDTLETGASRTIDFDGDGNDDIALVLESPFEGFVRAVVFSDDANGGGIVGVGPQGFYDYFYADVLEAGAPISDATVVQNTNTTDDGTERDDFLLASTYMGTVYGNWAGETDKYLGVRFMADVGGAATTHYAWLRLDVADATELTIKDYAFESTPDTAIEAGDTGASGPPTAVDPSALPDGYAFAPIAPNPTAGPTRFDLRLGQAERVRIEVFDALGRSARVLHDGPLAGGPAQAFTLDGGDLPAGVYAVRVVGESFDTTRTFTVVR